MAHVDRLEVAPALGIGGEVTVPGDKSISHRLAMVAAVAEGTTTIRNFAGSADCQTTLKCLAQLGVSVKREGSTVSIEGRGLEGLQKPAAALDAENSGTTVRLMSGLLAGCPFRIAFVGDESLSRRPMQRVIQPLRRMGVTIEAREDNYLPLIMEGGPLSAISYTLPVASAQVKSAVLLASLHARGVSRVREPIPTRNHTEIALAEFGVKIESGEGSVEILGGQPLTAKTFTVPGDISSAAFLIASALAVPGSKLKITDVGLNPTRTGFIDLLQRMGAKIAISDFAAGSGEPKGNLTVETSELGGAEIGARCIPNLIDELPVLAVLGTRTKQGIRIRDAAELRAKESDRIRSVATNLKALGAKVEEYPDGLYVPGEQKLTGGAVDSFGDHRIAMAFAVAGLFAEGPVTILNPSCVAISYPGFFETLRRVAATR